MNQPKIDINLKFLDYLIKVQHRYAILYGGAGSGKSRVAAQKVLFRVTTEPKHRFLVVRKVARTLKRSVFQNIKDRISENNLNWRFKINTQELTITDIVNGNEILFAGVDDPEKLKSIEGVTSVWIEEGTEFDEIDFTQINLRLRGFTPNYKQITITFNPVDERHWIKPKFFDTDKENVYILHSTFLDNAFIDAAYINTLQDDIGQNANDRRIYLEGKWGRIAVKGRFWESFKFDKHTAKIAHKYNPHLPLHLSFDFNVFPYITGGLWQIQGKEIYKLKEYCLEHPRNKSAQICRAFAKDFPNHSAGLFIYGDPSGKNQDTRSENDYTIIFRELQSYAPKDRVLKAHPPVATSGTFVNRLFDEMTEYRVTIDSGCGNTIDDFLYVQEDADGTMMKKKVTDKVSGRRYEELGHTSDESRYFLVSALKDDYRKYTEKGTKKPIIGTTSSNNNRFF